MKKSLSGKPVNVDYGPPHCIRAKGTLIFAPVFDFGEYTKSELDEIQEHMTLEAYALSEKLKEREQLFLKARKWDARKNRDVI